MMSKGMAYLKEGEHEQMAASFGMAALEIASPDQLVDMASAVVGLLHGDDKAKNFLESIPTRFVPFGAAMTDARQTVDPVMRSMRTEQGGLNGYLEAVQNRFSNMVPYYSKTLPPQRNLYGEVLMLPDGIGPDAFSPFATTTNEGMAIKKGLENLQDYHDTNGDMFPGLAKLDIKMPSRTINVPGARGVELSPQQYDRYMQFYGGLDLPKEQQLKHQIAGVVEKYGLENVDPTKLNKQTIYAAYGELSAYLNFAKKRASAYMANDPEIREEVQNQLGEVMRYQNERK
jgi:hypothetical protein